MDSFWIQDLRSPYRSLRKILRGEQELRRMDCVPAPRDKLACIVACCKARRPE